MQPITVQRPNNINWMEYKDDMNRCANIIGSHHFNNPPA